MDRWISQVLRLGVLVSAAIILAGLALYVTTGAGRGSPTSLSQLLAGGGHPTAINLPAVLRGVRQADAGAIIDLGVLALILTPVIRVAMTMVLFLVEQDRVFSLITTAVLIILVVGLVGIGS